MPKLHSDLHFCLDDFCHVKPILATLSPAVVQETRYNKIHIGNRKTRVAGWFELVIAFREFVYVRKQIETKCVY